MSLPERGICRLSLAPVFESNGKNKKTISQLLFGEHYTVLEKAKGNNWILIENYFDGTAGWINALHHHIITEAYFEQINFSDYKICLDTTASILFNKEKLTILLGSILPISTNELFKIEEQLAFNGEAKSLSQKRDFEFLKLITLKFLHSPEVEGGRSPFGIDASGLIQQVFRMCGYILPRTLDDLQSSGDEVSEFSGALPGDIAFFSTNSSKISNVGIILDDETVIYNHGFVRKDKLTGEGIIKNESGKLIFRLEKIKRILKLDESKGFST